MEDSIFNTSERKLKSVCSSVYQLSNFGTKGNLDIHEI